MSKKLVNPEELFDGSVFGMSQAVIDTNAKLLFISGQVAWNHSFEVTSPTIEGQCKKALENLSAVLKASDASIADLLRVRVYVRGEFGAYLNVLSPILMEYLGSSKPALTGIGVASLASPDTLIEIEGVARLG
ncbi:RidA family protein [Maribacter sp. 2-571]|uniref:RidA family protein n=1 Tax=Maribacter sp. 2-571 TaxID=3417569 RepID=UPI003D33D8F5